MSRTTKPPSSSSRPIVRVTKLRTLTPATAPDLTGPLRQDAAQGQLLQLEMGYPLRVRLGDGREWRTSEVRSITPGVRFVEVATKNTLYHLHYRSR